MNNEISNQQSLNLFNVVLVSLVLLGSLLSFPGHSETAQNSALQASAEEFFTPCRVSVGALIEEGECATLKRPENPNAPDGKILELFVAKFPSTSPSPELDAFTIIQGGPGMSSIDLYLGRQQGFQQIRRNRDIILIDQRGTGRSHPFLCPLENLETADVSPEEARQLAVECLQNFDGDARHYTTHRAIEDLEALRVAANYPQLTIYGVSYGTRVALEYARAYPAQTRALLLDGVVAPTVNLAGNEIAERSQQAFDRLIEVCKADSACTQAHGDLKSVFESVRADLAAAPKTVFLAHPITGELVEREVVEMDLLSAMRMMPYATESLALLPLLLTQASQGQFTMLAAQALMLEEQFLNHYAVGMNNSVMCTEDYPYLSDAQRQPNLDTYFGDTMTEMVQAMCEVWPRGDDYSASRTEFDSQVPTLIMSGEVDPITPPENGDVVDAMLSNSRHIVVPAQGHGVFDRGCMLQIVSNFVDQANFEDFDATCVEREIPFPIFIDTTGPAQ